jgi:hypothetical protein
LPRPAATPAPDGRRRKRQLCSELGVSFLAERQLLGPAPLLIVGLADKHATARGVARVDLG